MKSKILVIAGTEKAATTSIYSALSSINEFNTSLKKETDHLRLEEVTLRSYLSCFNEFDKKSYYLEASPGYLSESHIVRNNIMKLCECEFNLIFILRSPIKKLISSYSFHQSRLYIPKSVSFDDYIKLCFDSYLGEKNNLELSDWCLSVPKHGLYFDRLSNFKGIKNSRNYIYEFNDFVNNPVANINSLLSSIGIEATISHMPKSNEGHIHKSDIIQKIALTINNNLESFFYDHPKVKSLILRVYKKLNTTEKPKITISKGTKKALFDYYIDDMEKLLKAQHINPAQFERWCKDFD